MSRHFLSMIVSIPCILPVAAAAQDGPTFDCGKAESSAEKLVCTDPALAELDQRLAVRFAAAETVASGLDVGSEQATRTLRAMQRGWISGRDECWKEDDLRSCVEEAYLRREAELVAEFLLEEPATVQTFQCDASSGGEFVTYRFATPLPAVRLERGDSVYVGALLSTEDPGTFYLRSSGSVSFEDAAATLTDPYGAAEQCTLSK